MSGCSVGFCVSYCACVQQTGLRACTQTRGRALCVFRHQVRGMGVVVAPGGDVLDVVRPGSFFGSTQVRCGSQNADACCINAMLRWSNGQSGGGRRGVRQTHPVCALEQHVTANCRQLCFRRSNGVCTRAARAPKRVQFIQQDAGILPGVRMVAGRATGADVILLRPEWIWSWMLLRPDFPAR